jgi:hypothetical protein
MKSRNKLNWLRNKVACIILVIICSIFTIPYQIYAKAQINDEERNNALSLSLTHDDQPIIPLYPSLKWNDEIAKTQMLSLDGYPKPVIAPGFYFESASFYVREKPPRSIYDYYSSNQMLNYKWERLGYLDKPNSIGIMYQHTLDNRYMTVFIEACNNNDGELDGLNSLPAHFYCVKVWFSEILPLASQLQPSDTLSSNNIIPYVPLGVNYDNPLLVPLYSQRNSDPENNIVLGWGCNWVTIHDDGCALTAYTMLYNYYQPDFTTVLELNESMKVPPGVYDCRGNCCDWWPLGTPDAPSEVSFGTRYVNTCTSANCIDSGNVPIIDNEINSGHPLYIRVHAVDSALNSHAIVMTGHSGSDYYINDPWATDDTQLTLESGALGPYVVDYIDTIIGTPPPQAFDKITPVDGSSDVTTTPTLSWESSSGATSYEYCLNTTNDCSEWISNGTDTSKELSGLSPSTTYYWHVQAVNSVGTTYSNGSDTAFWSFTTEAPTAVKLVDFRTISVLQYIQLNWQTAQEIDLLGFNLFRAEALDGLRLMINPQMIPAINPGQLQGNAYQYLDATTEAGKVYYYWIEWVGRSGSEFFGPATTNLASYMVWLPMEMR